MRTAFCSGIDQGGTIMGGCDRGRRWQPVAAPGYAGGGAVPHLDRAVVSEENAAIGRRDGATLIISASALLDSAPKEGERVVVRKLPFNYSNG